LISRQSLVANFGFPFRILSGTLRQLKFLASPIARYLLAILGGLALALSFPKAGVAGLAWVAPGLILISALGRPGASAFRLGYVAGLAFHLTALYWLLFIPFPAGAIAGWLALSAYLSLFTGLWVWLCWKLFPTPSNTGSGVSMDSHSVAALPVPSPLQPVLAVTWWQRARWALFCAALWVAIEMIVGRLFSGFPWLFLGVSQYRMLPLIQVSAFTGVHGVSFLAVWFAVSLLIVLLRLAELPRNRWTWTAELRVPLIALLAIAGFGFTRVLSLPPVERELKAALIQPSIAQEVIWDHREDSNRFAKIMNLSRLALAARPDLLVWPEAALPAFTGENFRAMTNLVTTHQVWMVFGADDAERRPTASDPEHHDYFNAAFLFDPAGRLAGTYRKRQLVIFGEYVPLSRWLPFLKHLTPITGGFTSGPGPSPFSINPPAATFAVLICFEDVFGRLARKDVNDNTDFLLNLTNDGWFGQSAAQWQQAANAVFRAVENGVPLVRCTNNGLTCWIDARGRLRQIHSSPDGDVYGPGFMIARIPLLAPGRKNPETFYRRHGDWFGWGCLLVSAVVVARRWSKSGTRPPGSQGEGSR